MTCTVCLLLFPMFTTFLCFSLFFFSTDMTMVYFLNLLLSLPLLVGCAADAGVIKHELLLQNPTLITPLSRFTEDFSDPPSPPSFNLSLTVSHHDTQHGKSPYM